MTSELSPGNGGIAVRLSARTELFGICNSQAIALEIARADRDKEEYR